MAAPSAEMVTYGPRTVQGPHSLSLLSEASPVDKEAVERAVGDLLVVLGQNISDGPLSRTAAEVAEAYQALLDPRSSEVEVRCDSDGSSELVLS